MVAFACVFPNGPWRTKTMRQRLCVRAVESWMGWEGIGQKGFTPHRNAYVLDQIAS